MPRGNARWRKRTSSGPRCRSHARPALLRTSRGHGISVVQQPSKLSSRVRFPVSAPISISAKCFGSTAVSKTAGQGSTPWAGANSGVSAGAQLILARSTRRDQHPVTPPIRRNSSAVERDVAIVEVAGSNPVFCSSCRRRRKARRRIVAPFPYAIGGRRIAQAIGWTAEFSLHGWHDLR